MAGALDAKVLLPASAKLCLQASSANNPYPTVSSGPDEASVAYRVVSHDTFIIFHGTDFSWRDWGANLYAAKRGFLRKGRVHRGFSWNLPELWAKVEDLEHFDQPRPGNIYLIGHSRGGALATLIAFALYHVENIKVAGVVTFGSPRVGNIDFAHHYNAMNIPTFRVVNKFDIVARVPTFNYYHVGTRTPGPGWRHVISNYQYH